MSDINLDDFENEMEQSFNEVDDQAGDLARETQTYAPKPDPVVSLSAERSKLGEAMNRAAATFPSTNPENIANTLTGIREKATGNIASIEAAKMALEDDFKEFAARADAEISAQKLTLRMMDAAITAQKPARSHKKKAKPAVKTTPKKAGRKSQDKLDDIDITHTESDKKPGGEDPDNVIPKMDLPSQRREITDARRVIG